MISVTVSNFKDFREKAREFLKAGYSSRDIFFSDEQTGHLSLLSSAEAAHQTEKDSQSVGLPQAPIQTPASPGHERPFKVPAAFIELGEMVETHTNPQRWAHLYNLLEKLKRSGPQILKVAVDDDVRALEVMAKQIRRDIHKMHAFVRFRKKVLAGIEMFIAWYEPDHLILKQATPFFERRFGAMEFIIATPHGAAYWNKKEMQYHLARLDKKDYEQAPDAFEEYWLSYYAHIFNPARIKIKAMKNEMPVRFWKNLPEAKIIDNLLLKAPSRVEAMHGRMKNQAEETAEPFLPNQDNLQALRDAANSCRGCPLFKEATQTVFGSGNSKANVVIVGEQPGHEEDLQGQPFVGPAGQLLKRVLNELQVDTNQLYFTNAVKHFHFEEKGSMRLHKTPKTSHVRACKPWLARELKILKPKLIICLGATASQAVVGFPLNMTRDRGRLFKTEFSEQTLVTFHPSYLLRLKDQVEIKKTFAHFARDLSLIKNF